MLLFKKVACNDCHVWTVGFGRGFCRGKGWGSETRPDCEVDWRGLGAGELGKLSREEKEVSWRGSEKASHMRLQHT